MDIIVDQLDQSFLKVKCEPAIAHELSAFFTFKVPGAEFTKPYKNKWWDGYIRLFNLKNYHIYCGLAGYLKAFAAERNYSISLPNFIDDKFSVLEAKKYMESLNPHSNKKPLGCRDYQFVSFASGIQKRRMLLVSPTSSGKSLIIYTLARYLTEEKAFKKGLIIVPTINLVDQLYNDFVDYSYANKYDVEANVHQIYQGQAKNTNKKITISTWQSIYDLPPEYFEQFDFVIGDEAHLFKAQSLTKIMTKSKNALYKIGMTGTLDGTQTHRLVLEGLFGPVKNFVTTKQLQDRKQVADLTIKCLFFTYPPTVCRDILGIPYREEVDFICAHRGRNEAIKKLVDVLKGNSLILFRYVEKHGKILYELIQESLKNTNRKVYFVHGGVDKDEREQIRQIVNTEKDAVIVASMGTFSTGINIPHIHNIVFSSPSKSRIAVLQSIGRGLRLGEFKEHCTLYDIVDDFSIGSNTNAALDHFNERFSYYVDEQFEYEFYNINITKEA